MPRTQTTLPIGAGPKSVAAGTGGFYVGLFDREQLVRTAAGGTAAIWQVDTGPGRTNGVAAWGDVVVTTNRDLGTVTLHDAISGARTATLAVGSLPWGVAAADGRAYVANFGDSSVSVIDLVAQRVLATVPVSPNPVGVAAALDGAYVVHLDGRVTHLDAGGRVLARGIADAPDARGIAWDLLRARVYVGSLERRIIALDAATLQPVARFDLPGPAYGLALNPGTGRLYAVDAVANRLYVVEPDGSGIGEIALPEQGVRDGGMGIAAWDNRIAVANFAAGSLTLVDDAICAGRLTPTPAGASRTPTATPSPTASRTATSTPTPAPTSTRTPSPTASATASSTATRTLTPISGARNRARQDRDRLAARRRSGARRRPGEHHRLSDLRERGRRAGRFACPAPLRLGAHGQAVGCAQRTTGAAHRDRPETDGHRGRPHVPGLGLQRH